ncbi:MAG TPA: metalloregulator ArsR/SmtB family transcription factor [Chloroflexota bacterium]|nr:metalloregulator ArsR/SmtB family transcription factor [Chloroflexota bacterium]
MSPDPLDRAFKALADPSRRRLLDRLNADNGQTLSQLCAGLDMARQSVSKHLAVLEAANLITTVWQGREKLHYLNAAPISDISERWISAYDRNRVGALSELKLALEDASMAKPKFVYTAYIHTTPELLWRALTEPAFTRRYWGVSFETDWKTGSTYAMSIEGKDVTIADAEQMILESDPPRRLSYSWHTFTPEWAAAYDIDEEYQRRVSAERRSKVTFEIEPVDDQVRLTVIHDDFDDDSAVFEGISSGWPQIVSELKWLLESPPSGS